MRDNTATHSWQTCKVRETFVYITIRIVSVPLRLSTIVSLSPSISLLSPFLCVSPSLFQSVNVHAHAHAHVRVCVCVCVHKCTCTLHAVCASMCMCVQALVCGICHSICVDTCMCVNLYVYLLAGMCVYNYVCKYGCINIYVLMTVCVDACIHAFMQCV